MSKKVYRELTDEQRRLVVSHMEYAAKLAYSYRNCLLPTLTPEDMIQEAYMGLCKAAAGFVPDQGAVFETYAYPFVVHELYGAIVRYGSSMRVPLEMREAALVVSLDTQLEDGSTLMERMGGWLDADDEDVCLIAERHEAVMQALECLSDTERAIVERYFGLDEDGCDRLRGRDRMARIAEQMHVSPEHASRLKQRALNKLELDPEAMEILRRYLVVKN